MNGERGWGGGVTCLEGISEGFKPSEHLCVAPGRYLEHACTHPFTQTTLMSIYYQGTIDNQSIMSMYYQ